MIQTVYSDKQLVIDSESQREGLRLSGEIDAWNVGPVTKTLADHISDRDLHLDLSRLSFVDVEGIRAFISLAASAPGEHRVILHGLAPQLGTVLHLVGWTQMPNLVVWDGTDNQ